MNWTSARRAPVLTALVAACALAACGGDDDQAASTTPATSGGADLRVTVRADGPGRRARTRTIVCERVGAGADTATCRRLDTVSAKTLAPVPGTVACTQVFGGPAVATVRGSLRGERVSSSFELSDGCEIARWRDNATLLGAPPGNPPGG